MKYIKTKAVAEAARLAEQSTETAVRLRPNTAKENVDKETSNINGEATEQVVQAGKEAIRLFPHSALFRGKKKETQISRNRDSKYIKTSEISGKNAIRTAEKRYEEFAVERNTIEEMARGSSMAKKALAMHKKTAADIRVTALSIKKTAGRMLRSAIKALYSQNAVFMGGGALALCLVTVISMVGGIAASPFGIFFSIEEDGGDLLRSILSDLSKEFYDPIQLLQRTIQYDILDIESDNGMYGVQWDEILPVWAVYRTSMTGKDAIEVDEDSKEQLRHMMNDLTFFTYEVTSVEIPIEEEEETENDQEEDEELFQEIITLTIRIRHGNISQYIERLGFTSQQMKLLEEVKEDRYRSFWAKTAGAYSIGGQILTPYGAVSGIFTWPMTISGSITSGFGYRADPFSGEQKFHGGIDIGAAQGTPILASAEGIVTVANGTDPWGGGYGYYVMISHGNGLETLYGHCSAICVTSGQAVQRGEVIAYVGSTGNSTGNHLHFEVRVNGGKTDPFNYLL